MFNLQGSEIVIVLLLALVVLGPEKLPDAMRKLGEFYAELKKMSSGFQSEFRAAIDEPMREVKDTANVLRDSADLTKLQNGEREEKPKSAEMGPVDEVAAVAPETVAPENTASETVADFDRPADDDLDGPGLAADSKPAPFSGQSSAAPRSTPIPEASSPATDAAVAGAAATSEASGAGPDEPDLSTDSKPAPFSGQSSAAPRVVNPSDRAAPVVGPADGASDASDHGDGPAVAEQPLGADDATGHAR